MRTKDSLSLLLSQLRLQAALVVPTFKNKWFSLGEFIISRNTSMDIIQ